MAILRKDATVRLGWLSGIEKATSHQPPPERNERWAAVCWVCRFPDTRKPARFAMTEIEAEIALSQRTRFVLDEEQWSAFIDLLERPVIIKPALERLLKKPSVFESIDP